MLQAVPNSFYVTGPAIAVGRRQASSPADERTLALTERLLTWTASNLPAYPWRDGEDPYAVWVAVVMLQQTRIATVLPYFERFMSRFGTIEELARAELGEVLKCWEGLGYYARARNLHTAARIVVNQHHGTVPADRSSLRELPGVGEYTASALLSIAFHRDVPALDGNIRRVVSRLYAIDDDPRRVATQRKLRELSQSLLPKGQAGGFNQGLMEFGADVCTSRVPRCDICPVPHLCLAHRDGLVEQIPKRRPRRKIPHYTVGAAVIRDEAGYILVSQRHQEDMLGGLWEFPGGRCEAGETLQDCVRREVEEELGILVQVQDHLVMIRHAYSHFRITLHAFNCLHGGGEPQALEVANWRWVAPSELRSLAFSATGLRIIDRLLEEGSEFQAGGADHRRAA